MQSYILTFKSILFAVSLIVIRAAFPRYRYDKLMNLGWLVFLPLTFAFIFLHGSLLYILMVLPSMDDIFLLSNLNFLSSYSQIKF